MKAHIITWAVSVLSAAVLGGAWLYTHPYQRIVHVDVVTLLNETIKPMEAKLKSGLSSDEQQAINAEIAARTMRLDHAITKLSEECNCIILNTAAILKAPKPSQGIPDFTDRIRELSVR